MKINNKTPEQAYYKNPNAIPLSEKIKELRKIAKKYEKDRETIITFSQLKAEVANELDLVQKEIKEVQGELKQNIPVFCHTEEGESYYQYLIIDKIFKNKFGELK